jgi:hypothetical protein
MWKSVPNFVQKGKKIRKVRVDIHSPSRMMRNHCCRAKTVSITCSECVSVALVIKHVKRTRLTVLWRIWLYQILYIIS